MADAIQNAGCDHADDVRVCGRGSGVGEGVRSPMTEAEWLASDDPISMHGAVPRALEHAGHRDPRVRRKRELFGAACCRLVWPEVIDARSRRCVEHLERQFDEERDLSGEQARAIFRSAEAVIRGAGLAGSESQREAAFAVHAACEPAYVIDCLLHFDGRGATTVHARQIADLLREIVGNPFRPVAFAPEWRTSTARAVALQMYETREFSAMPILADALQDAGCDSADVLDHCRGPGPHVYGCWVVDAVLAKG
ncbi:Uncharacterized protein (Fragment) OS=uncultured bacterium PE=4 SV=1 [Gemmata massiliana]|uniref:SMI1/KNR4 family protein n=1 Tax=Gemmata massiliana TaxID=1210884 RepID=A0A6P2D823_9BACT